MYLSKTREDDPTYRDYLKEIGEIGLPGLDDLLQKAKKIVIHRGTGWPSTRRTAKAVETYLKSQGYKVYFYINPYKRLGSKAMFDRLDSDDKLTSVVNHEGWPFAITNAKGNYYDQLRRGLLDSAVDIFFQLREGDLCISIGHSGLVEPLAHIIGPQKVEADLTLREKEGIVFVSDKNNGFQVEEIIRLTE